MRYPLGISVNHHLERPIKVSGNSLFSTDLLVAMTNPSCRIVRCARKPLATAVDETLFVEAVVGRGVMFTLRK